MKEVSHCFEIVSPSFSFKTKDQRHRDQGPKTKTKECYQYVWTLRSQLVLMLCSVRSRWIDLILGGHLLCFSTNFQEGKEPRTNWTYQQLLPARLKQDKEEIDISHSQQQSLYQFLWPNKLPNDCNWSAIPRSFQQRTMIDPYIVVRCHPD